MSKKSMSLARSEISQKSRYDIKQTKSVDGLDEYPIKYRAQWYDAKCNQVVNQVPSTLPLLKNSQPYRLTIERVSNITVTKKSVHSACYLRLMISFLTTQLQVIGKTCYHQCESPISADGKYLNAICLYYHSRIDRTCDRVKMIIRFDTIELREGVVDSVANHGFAVIGSPFGEQQVKNMNVFKQCSEIEAISRTIESPNVANVSFAYRIQSTLQLKTIIKVIPSQTIVSTQTHIAGLLQNYVPLQKQQNVQQQDISCQIHIPQKFEEQVKSALKQLPFVDKTATQNISFRRIICGFHNQFQMVSPVIRNLDLLGKEMTGQVVIHVYEGLGDKELIKVPYYLQERDQQKYSSLTISLVYNSSGVDYQIAMFAFAPNLAGSSQQISASMIIGGGIGFYTNLLPIKTSHPPTIIFQYISEQPLKVHQFDQARSKSGNRLRTQHRIPFKSSKQGIQSSKFMEQLQRERLQLEHEKQQLQYLKTQNFVNYQDDFEKKLQEEREQLRLRQEIIENQYKEEVQKQIRHKIQLENEIRLMKQKIAIIQEGYKSQMPSRKLSYEQTPTGEYDPAYTQPINSNFPFMRQKVNPNYLLQQQKTIPINEVRDIMAKTFQYNRQAIDKQLKMFNYASKFTFTFNSVIWSQFIDPPKSFYFVIRFFNFKQFTTDPLSYVQSDLQYHQLIRMHHYTYNLQDTTPCYIFTVDPSQYANPELLQEDLVNFICKNNTVVDIFDAQNYLYIGQINIKMNQLLRGAKSQVMIAKQYNMVRQKGQQNYGVIQILVKNQMVQCKQRISLNQKKKVKEIQKKVVSNNPILLSKQIYENQKQETQVGGIKHARNRQQKRIEMYKKKATENKKKNIYTQVQPTHKGNMLDKISQYKKMPDMIKKIYEDLLTQQITINPYFGQAKTFVYQFTNMSHTPCSFRVSIQGDQDELSLIKDSSEWRYFTALNRYPTPKIYDCINDQNSFYLSAGETISLLFRYLSFNKTNTSTTKSETVTITKQQNNWIVGGFALQIQSHESVINHSYVLYQPGGQLIDLIIPVVYSSNEVKLPKRLFLTIQQATAEWVSQFEILLRVRTPQIMSKLKFHLLLYEDDYFCELRENWLIQMFAYEGVYAVSRPDQKTKFKISVPEHVISALRPGRINFYSSSPDLMFQNQFIQGLRLTKGSAQVWCQLFPSESNLTSIQITCVNERKQLLYGWIVQVYPYSFKM